jgi:two-component system, sensor histidine kinase and response regulator
MGARILAVDDEPINLSLLEALVKRFLPDAEIRTAQGGQAALAAVRKSPPDIVLLDAQMSDLDGFEVCRRIKTDPATSRVRVLMVSGAYIESRHRVSGFEGGADGYICKPFRPNDLMTQIQALLVERAEKEPVFRVIIADDSRTSRQVLISELKRISDVQVASFDSAEAAVAALDALKPDLIIADAAMPRMDGLEFCGAVRAHPDHEKTPFLLLSEAPTEALRRRGAERGVTEIFPKPYPPQTISRYVSRHMDARRDWFDHDVLVVDEDLATRKTVKQYLSGIRLRVHEAGNLDEAAEVLRRGLIDLIVVGHLGAGGSGCQWIESLRASEEHRWIPILGISPDTRTASSFIGAGADDCVSRELIQDEIVLRARNLLKRVSLTRQLNAAVQRERELNEHRNRLFGIAAHDIRSPLTAISHYAESLLASPLNNLSVVKDRLQNIHGLARHSLEMLNTILDAGSIRSGVVAVRMERFRLNELLAERLLLANELGLRKDIRGTLVNRVPDGLAEVCGDRQRLAQVLDNLFGNVIKYCHDGTDFAVSLDAEVEGWLVQVEDHGPGIPCDELFGVFDEFGRTSVEPTGGEKGTGLGLAIVKKLVELHGGTVWMDSEVGKGTRVSVVLPRPAPTDEKGKERA